MIRRKLTLKRVDPWTVLKFGFVVNLVLLLVGLLAFWVIWAIIGRLGLIEQFCGSVGTIVLDLQDCGINGAGIFRALLFLGVLGVIVQTGIFVLFAFLYNLIADLTGGLGFTYLDESNDAVAADAQPVTTRDQPHPDTASGTNREANAGAATGAAASERPAGPNTASGPSTPSEPAQAPPQAPSSDRSGQGNRRPASDPEGESDDGERRPQSLWDDPTRVQGSD